MSLKLPNICAVVADVASVMSKFVQSSNPIHDKYPNRPNNHKIQGGIFLDKDVQVVWRWADAIPVFVFTHADFPDKKFYTAKQYIHKTQEGTEKSLFVLAEAPVPASGTGGIGALEVGRNSRTDGAEEKMPQIHYRVVCPIYVQNTWQSFAVKGSLFMMITIQHRRT